MSSDLSERLAKLNVFELSIVGNLDSMYKLPEVPAGIQELKVNWQLLDHINSSGVLIWMRWLKDVTTTCPNVTLIYVNCPTMVINVINIVAGFLPEGGRVESVEVPFQCSKCGRGDKSTLCLNVSALPVPLGKLEDFEKELRGPNCKRLDCSLELDVSAKFFNFLKQNKMAQK